MSAPCDVMKFICLAICLLGQIALGGDESFFAAAGLSSAELAATETLPPVSSLATLPASDAERKELAASLLEQSDPEKVDIAAQLVEIWGDPEGAIRILESHTGRDPMHLVRLLYRTGDTQRAARVFSEIQTTGQPGPGLHHMPRFRTFMAAWPFLIDRRLHEMAAFLAWLQPQCWQSEWKSAVLALRLEHALHSSTLEPWMKGMARESTVARDIANRWLDPSTPEFAPNAGTSIADLAWMVSIEGCTDKNAPYIMKSIESGAGGEKERKELLDQIVQRSADLLHPRMDLLNAWMKREREFITLITQMRSGLYVTRGLPHDALCALGAKHPEDYLLNFIAGHNQTGRLAMTQQVPVTQAAIDSLERAFLASPLIAVAPDFNPQNHAWYPGAGMYYLQHWNDDPAFRSLVELRDRLSSWQLHELVHRHEDFAKLPPHGRHRYLRAAALDVPATQLVFDIDWADPANDIVAQEVGISHGTVLPTEELEKYHEILPRIMLGSSRKSAGQVAAHSGAAFALLFHEPSRLSPGQRRMLIVWGNGLLDRGPAYVDSVMGKCFRGYHSVNDELFVEIFGKETAARLLQLRTARSSIEAKASAIAWFGPTGLHGFPFGYEPELLARHSSFMIMGPGLLAGDYPEYPPSAWLAPRYPALAAILDAEKFGGFSDEVRACAAKIRRVLPPRSSLAAGHDIAIMTGDLPMEDVELSKQARTHVGQLLARAMDADFVFRRASRGAILAHARPPEDPAAIEELMVLRDAPTPVRMAVRDLAVWSNQEFRQRIGESFGEVPVRQYMRREPPPGPPPPQHDFPSLFKMAMNMPDAEALADFLVKLPETHQISPFDMLSRKDLVARFESPMHPHLLHVLGVRHEPATGLSGTAEAMRPPTWREIVQWHEFLFEQDPAAARTFRQLVVERGWHQPASVAAELLRHGEREEVVRWLARAILVGCYPPPEWQGSYRFPKPRTAYHLGSLSRVLPYDALDLIAHEKLALPVANAMEMMPHGDDPVLLGFLRFFDAPSLENFDRHLGGFDTPENPTMSQSLAIHISSALRHMADTRELAKQLQNRARETPQTSTSSDPRDR